MYKLWKSINSSKTEPCVCVKHMVGQIIPQTTTIQKAVIDDIINIYRNRNGHLPQADGRIWYEADINYTGSYRSRHRILYSNDGLIFVTYDHYETFAEIV